MESSRSTRSSVEASGSTRRGDSGWAAFAGVVMVIVGSLDALWGLGGILNDDIVVVGGQGALVADITLWGLGATAARHRGRRHRRRPADRQLAARWFGVLFVSINAISQIRRVPAAPLWAFLLIILDVVIIYQLTARWDVQARWD